MVKQKESVLSNTRIAIVFFVFLVFIIGISLVFKVIGVVRAGQFDDSRRFTITMNSGKNTQVMSISPNSKNIAIFKLNNNVKPAEAGRLLEIPVDGFISSDVLDLNEKIGSLFMKTIFSYNSVKTNLTVVDLLKLSMLTRTIPENSIDFKLVGDINPVESDKIVGHLVSDDLIEKEHQTIQIINGTGIGGFGNRLARLVGNMGGDVIIVATSDSPKNKSFVLYIDKKNYTVERLRKVLGYEAVRESDNAISDITIVIGKDKVNSAPF